MNISYNDPQSHYIRYDLKPVIIDTDLGLDDILAILYLLNNPKINVTAITTNKYGLANREMAVFNLSHILKATDNDSIPIGVGRPYWINLKRRFPKEWRTQADAVLGLARENLIWPRRLPSSHKLIKDKINNTRAKSTILALGPLNNLSATFWEDKYLLDHVERIYISGGAVDVPGNVTDNINSPDIPIEQNTSEWNFYIHPISPNVFLEHLPVSLVPLDVTEKWPITLDFIQRLGREAKTATAILAHNILTINLSNILDQKQCFWDLTAAILLCNPNMLPIENVPINVDYLTGRTYRAIEYNDYVSKTDVYLQFDEQNRQNFEDEFIRVLNIR